MQRMQVYFTEIQYKALKQLSEERDMSMSEILRRSIDLYINSAAVANFPKDLENTRQ